MSLQLIMSVFVPTNERFLNFNTLLQRQIFIKILRLKSKRKKSISLHTRIRKRSCNPLLKFCHFSIYFHFSPGCSKSISCLRPRLTQRNSIERTTRLLPFFHKIFQKLRSRALILAGGLFYYFERKISPARKWKKFPKVN